MNNDTFYTDFDNALSWMNSHNRNERESIAKKILHIVNECYNYGIHATTATALVYVWKNAI